MKCIRVLHVVEELSAAGIESFIMNVYRNIDRSKVQFDFLVLRNEREFYDDEIRLLGGKKYFICSDKSNTALRVLEESGLLENFLRNHHYEIVHMHFTTPLRGFYLKAAAKAGVRTRIYHSHSAEVSGKSKIKLAIYNYCKNIIDKYATHCFACSEAAAKWAYSQNAIQAGKTKIIYNGIDTRKFKFDYAVREDIRKELNINESYVLIHTGRFTEQKNQSFILDIFKALRESTNGNIKLLLLGDGPLKETCIEKCKRLELDNDVFFLGVRKNVQDYLFAADCYIMPSLYEGLPVAGIEAECTGLPCIFSKNITNEVSINSNVCFVRLDNQSEWLEVLGKMKRENDRARYAETIKKSGYDICDVAFNMEEFYLNEEKNDHN